MRTAQSSHIAGHDYDQETGTLVIQFTNGAVYSYSGISPTEYYNFAQSSSPGTYFWAKIRDSKPGAMISPGDKRSGRKRAPY